MRGMLRTLGVGCGTGLGLLTACGAEDRQAPRVADLVIAKTETNSGDQQVAVAGAALEQELRVVVTRDSRPAEHVTVIWSTQEGILTPTRATTGADGISSARWTLQDLLAQQAAFASLDTSAPPAVVFTATATPDPRAPNTVLVGGDAGNRFDPAEVIIEVGGTVHWFWPAGSSGHNVVPDDGSTPSQSGPLVGYPKFYGYQFAHPGTYIYHCMAHGGVGGVGMSGRVTVLPGQSLSRLGPVLRQAPSPLRNVLPRLR